jgi:hypothetical protein
LALAQHVIVFAAPGQIDSQNQRLIRQHR